MGPVKLGQLNLYGIHMCYVCRGCALPQLPFFFHTNLSQQEPKIYIRTKVWVGKTDWISDFCVKYVSIRVTLAYLTWWCGRGSPKISHSEPLKTHFCIHIPKWLCATLSKYNHRMGYGATQCWLLHFYTNGEKSSTIRFL